MRYLLCAAAALAACDDPFGLPAARFSSFVDTLTLYALHGTPIASPSALRLSEIPTTVRPDQTTNFDFAFDIDAGGRALLLSTGALDLGRGSGTQTGAQPFDSIRVAPSGGYDLDSALVVTAGSVVLLRSRPSDCGVQLAASYFFYAKLEVLAIEPNPGPDGRRIQFQILVDRNCGYRGLEPGLPSR